MKGLHLQMLNNVHIHTRKVCVCARGHLPAWTRTWQRKKTSYVPPEPFLDYLTW